MHFGVLLCVSVSMSICVQPVTEIGMGRRVRLSVDTFYNSLQCFLTLAL